MRIKSIIDIRCPCGNPVNNQWLLKASSKSVTFIFECWSGILHKEMPRHYFKQTIELRKKRSRRNAN